GFGRGRTPGTAAQGFDCLARRTARFWRVARLCLRPMRLVETNLSPSFRGSAAGPEPGIPNLQQWLWIPGSPRFATAPRNDTHMIGSHQQEPHRHHKELPMAVARHPRPKELVGVPVEEIMNRYVARFRDRKPDWAAFEDAKIEGYKRAQHRFIGAGGSGKHGDPTVIPAGNFTLSIMFVNPGQGNAAHTHEVEECFFVLQGLLDVFVEDESGNRVTTRLGP